MKKILAFLILCSAVITANAQVQRKKAPAADSSGPAKAQVAVNKNGRKEMMKQLQLSKLQKHQLKEMRQSGKTKMAEIQNNAALTESEKKTKLKELKKQQAESTLQVLNEEQKTKFKKMQKEKRHHNKDAEKDTQ